MTSTRGEEWDRQNLEEARATMAEEAEKETPLEVLRRVKRENAEVEYMREHARAYAVHQGEDKPDRYADWYVLHFGDDGIERAPSHSSVYWSFVKEYHPG